ncbi:MAG TPA: DUF3341 domain-containing protein [Mesorhizobium sp.]|jgi:hypothetical protein|nr:DUF3341 domain-containing protein [Mesorhizobium sp.]
MAAVLFGLAAEFDTPERLVQAVERAREAGYTKLEAFSPFPLKQAADGLGERALPLFVIAAGAALVGASIQYGAQFYLNAVDYPLNVGGRPLHSWPAFIPATLIVAILWAGVATLLTFLFRAGLPRLHHPVFAVPGFERASEDRFFLVIEHGDPQFEPQRCAAFLESLGPSTVREVPAS